MDVDEINFARKTSEFQFQPIISLNKIKLKQTYL